MPGYGRSAFDPSDPEEYLADIADSLMPGAPSPFDPPEEPERPDPPPAPVATPHALSYPEPDFSRRDALLRGIDQKRKAIPWPLASMQRQDQQELENLTALLREADQAAHTDHQYRVQAWQAAQPKPKTFGPAIYGSRGATQLYTDANGQIQRYDVEDATPPSVAAARERNQRPLRVDGGYVPPGGEFRRTAPAARGVGAGQVATLDDAGQTQISAPRFRPPTPPRKSGAGKPDYTVPKEKLADIRAELKRVQNAYDDEAGAIQPDKNRMGQLNQRRMRLVQDRDTVIQQMGGEGATSVPTVSAPPAAVDHGPAGPPANRAPSAQPVAGTASKYKEGQTATNKKTGEVLVYRGGKWVPQ